MLNKRWITLSAVSPRPFACKASTSIIRDSKLRTQNPSNSLGISWGKWGRFIQGLTIDGGLKIGPNYFHPLSLYYTLALVIPPQSLPSPVFRSIGKYFVTGSYDFDFFNCTVHKGDTRHQLQNLTTIKLISNTGKKRERKEKEKNNDYQKFALKRFEPGPSEIAKP